jgi:hypothetical protein
MSTEALTCASRTGAPSARTMRTRIGDPPTYGFSIVTTHRAAPHARTIAIGAGGGDGCAVTMRAR